MLQLSQARLGGYLRTAKDLLVRGSDDWFPALPLAGLSLAKFLITQIGWILPHRPLLIPSKAMVALPEFAV